MIDYQLHVMLGRMFEHTQSMRKYQQNLKLMNTKYDRKMASMFEQQVDLVSEYKLRNFDNLIKAAEERGAKAEAERASRASSQSTTPNAKQGMQEPEKGKITSIADLNKWLEDNK